MISDFLFFFVGMIVLAAVQFLSCWVYLIVANKVSDPITIKGQITMWIAWISMVVMVGTIGVLGIKLITFYELPINKALGIIPLVLGSAISAILQKKDWQAFSKKFQQKKK